MNQRGQMYSGMSIKVMFWGSPVVVRVVPVVEMNQEPVIYHISDGCYADEGGVHTVDGLQLHSNLKTALHIRLNGEQKH